MKRKIIFYLTESIQRSDSDTSTNSNISELSSFSSQDSWIENEDEDKDTLFFPLIMYLTSGYKRHKIENYLAIVESLTDIEFKGHFRLSRKVADELINEIGQSPFIPQHSFGIRPISGKLSILMFLWFMANTEPLRTIADRFDVSISSIFRVVRRVIAWMLTKLNDIIKWPQDNNVMTVCEQFFFKKGIPQVLGAIDCTHIRIEKPAVNANDYCNRKKYFSVHLQAVVDSDLCFTHVYCGEPGSLHDARVLRRSPLYNAANEDQETLFPQNTFIIGDSAYPLLPWLVSPFRDNGHLTPQQREFNYMLSSTRMVVEKAFGLLKARFRRIKFFTEYKHITFITDVIIAACILHNYCIMKNDIFENNDQSNDNNYMNEDNNIDDNIANEIVVNRRNQLFQELFS